MSFRLDIPSATGKFSDNEKASYLIALCSPSLSISKNFLNGNTRLSDAIKEARRIVENPRIDLLEYVPIECAGLGIDVNSRKTRSDISVLEVIYLFYDFYRVYMLWLLIENVDRSEKRLGWRIFKISKQYRELLRS